MRDCVSARGSTPIAWFSPSAEQAQVAATSDPTIKQLAAFIPAANDSKCGRRGWPRLPCSLGGLHGFLRPLFHILGRYIFDVSRDTPQMSEWILKESGPVHVELVLNRLENLRAFRPGFLYNPVNIGEVNVQAYRTGTNRSCAGVSRSHARILIGQHDV